MSNLRDITQKELDDVLRLHKLWLDNKDGGVRANLSYDILRGANLQGADLSYAILHGADLQGANMSGANLNHADLQNVNLRHTNMRMYTTDIWVAYIDPEFIRIGDEFHKAEQWWSFSDEEISSMSVEALAWWRINKPAIRVIHESLVKNIEWEERRRNLRKITQEELTEVLRLHKLWLVNEEGGVRANLSYTDLSGRDLRGIDLRHADMRHTSLQHANMRGANMRGTDLQGADMRHADLRHTNMRGANLRHADLRHADLRYTDLRHTNMRVYMSSLWVAYIDPEFIRIGCRFYKVEQWWSFSDEEISEMDDNALAWWRINKPAIRAIHESLVKELEGKSE